jgi:hypothetical protein
MFRLNRIFKNYGKTGSLSEQINLYRFIGPEVFLTKTGEVGLILEVRGVDYECLDGASAPSAKPMLVFLPPGPYCREPM